MKRTRTILTPELRKAKKAYWTHKYNAIGRDLKMELTFEQWYDIWLQSGHWEQRGRGKGKYCMSRIGDKGNYSLGNVFIQSIEQNSKDNINGGRDPIDLKEYEQKRGIEYQINFPGMGRPPIHDKAMSAAERQRRYRDKKRQISTI